jgi:hypothetical protein
MSFFEYIFSFLFVRNWHTGQKELSRPRVVLVCAGFFLLMIALAIIDFLQSPVVYIAP